MLHGNRTVESRAARMWWGMWGWKSLVLSCLVLLVILSAAKDLFISPAQAQAHSLAGPTFQVNAGFETRYRHGNWVPVQVNLRNEGPDFSGTLSVSADTPQYLGQSGSVTSANYQLPISLANGAQKRVTIYAPLYFDVQNITVKLLDGSSNTVGSQTATLNPLLPGDVFVGILSDQSAGFGPLNGAHLPNQNSSVALAFLSASTMPSVATALQNFNAIVLDNFTTSNLNAAQLHALQTWVYTGGTLLLVGGPEWRRTLSPLPAELVPVTLNGTTTTIPPGTSLLPPGGPGTGAGGQGQNVVKPLAGLSSPVTISTATAQGGSNHSEIVLASRTTPLIVQASRGQGTIIYLAFDPTLEPILGWQGARVFWESLLLRGQGDLLLSHAVTSSSTGSSNELEQPLLAYRMSTLLQSLLPSTVSTPWWTLALVFIGYLLVLGPVRLLLVARLKRRDWSWRIVLASIVVFSLLSYGLANNEKGASVLSNSISVAQLGQNGSPASITTYLGVFVPNQGNFQVHFVGNGMVQPSPDNLTSFSSGFSGPTAESPTTVAAAQDGTDLTLQDANIWTLHAILQQQASQVNKGLAGSLAISQGTLTGTVTNTLGYPLNDAFVLLPNDVFRLGHLAAGETKQVRLKLSSVPIPANNTLADLIALTTASPSYDALPISPQTAWQRHLAMLYALDGEGFYGSSSPCIGPCNPSLPAIPLLPLPPGIIPASTTNSSTANIIATAGWPYRDIRDDDPLLVPGVPATLIGWAENPLDPNQPTGDVTVNGIHPPGLHETLIKAPLHVDLAGTLSGGQVTLDLPPSFITGHVIDVEGQNAQFDFPGVYTISTGSMTFEYVVPTSSNLKISGLTITEPPNINVFAQAATQVNADSLPFRLYNWHTNTWDGIALNQNTFTTNNISAYIESGGSVLVQLANNDKSLGTFAFGKPSLNLQGVVLK